MLSKLVVNQATSCICFLGSWAPRLLPPRQRWLLVLRAFWEQGIFLPLRAYALEEANHTEPNWPSFPELLRRCSVGQKDRKGRS